WYIKFSNSPGRRDAAHTIARMFGKPHIAVAAERDDVWRTVRLGQRKFLIAGEILIDSSYRIAAAEREPYRAIRGYRQGGGPRVLTRQLKGMHHAIGFQWLNACCGQLRRSKNAGQRKYKRHHVRRDADLMTTAACRLAVHLTSGQ